jgi:hypothetical protein
MVEWFQAIFYDVMAAVGDDHVIKPDPVYEDRSVFVFLDASARA